MDPVRIFSGLVGVLAIFGLVVWAIRPFSAGRLSTPGGRGRVLASPSLTPQKWIPAAGWYSSGAITSNIC